MQRYNIALLPTDTDLHEKIIGISRQYFLDVQDEYILGPEGFPHLTLCQFKTENVDKAIEAYKSFAAMDVEKTPDITIEKFNARPGKLVNAGKFLVEYKAVPTEELLALQQKCIERLAAHDLVNLTFSDPYAPHITLSRLSALPEIIPTAKDLSCPFDFSTRLSLGLSTEAGVFVKELV